MKTFDLLDNGDSVKLLISDMRYLDVVSSVGSGLRFDRLPLKKRKNTSLKIRSVVPSPICNSIRRPYIEAQNV